jgi:predicted nucleic acid-binding protein
VVALVDTNVLVYRFDSRFPAKQAIATETLRRGIAEDTVYVPHQAVVEFIAAVTRADKNGESILSPQEAWREADEILYQFEILYPNEEVLRTAIRGAATYQLSWFDAHLWAYAEVFSLPELLSEDFADGRRYGTVRIVNLFRETEAE